MKTTADTFKGTACKKCGGVIRYKNSGKCVAGHAKRNEARKRGKGAKALIERPGKFDREPGEGNTKKKPIHWQQRIQPEIAYERDIRGVKTRTILEGLTPPGVDYSDRPYPGAPVEQKDWQIYAAKINEVWRGTWQKAIPGILETGKL